MKGLENFHKARTPDKNALVATAQVPNQRYMIWAEKNMKGFRRFIPPGVPRRIAFDILVPFPEAPIPTDRIPDRSMFASIVWSHDVTATTMKKALKKIAANNAAMYNMLIDSM